MIHVSENKNYHSFKCNIIEKNNITRVYPFFKCNIILHYNNIKVYIIIF